MTFFSFLKKSKKEDSEFDLDNPSNNNVGFGDEDFKPAFDKEIQEEPVLQSKDNEEVLDKLANIDKKLQYIEKIARESK